MKPLTNSQIKAAMTPEMRAAKRGTKTEVSLSWNLLRSHVLVRGTGRDHGLAEIRDSARNDTVVFRSSYDEVVAEAKKRGLWA